MTKLTINFISTMKIERKCEIFGWIIFCGDGGN